MTRTARHDVFFLVSKFTSQWGVPYRAGIFPNKTNEAAIYITVLRSLAGTRLRNGRRFVEQNVKYSSTATIVCAERKYIKVAGIKARFFLRPAYIVHLYFCFNICGWLHSVPSAFRLADAKFA